jgi:hypothetical protein
MKARRVFEFVNCFSSSVQVTPSRRPGGDLVQSEERWNVETSVGTPRRELKHCAAPPTDRKTLWMSGV